MNVTAVATQVFETVSGYVQGLRWKDAIEWVQTHQPSFSALDGTVVTAAACVVVVVMVWALCCAVVDFACASRDLAKVMWKVFVTDVRKAFFHTVKSFLWLAVVTVVAFFLVWLWDNLRHNVLMRSPSQSTHTLWRTLVAGLGL